MANIVSSPDNRVSMLKRLMNKDIVRILESHNSLTGLIIDKIKIIKNNKALGFDGMWSSSLTDSVTKDYRIILRYLFQLEYHLYTIY